MPKLVETRSIGRELARVGIERALEESTRIGCRTCVAVVDAAGHLVSFDRMDGAPFQSVQHALDKARSVAGNHTATHEMWNLVESDPSLRHGFVKVEGLVVLGGGLPIAYGEELLGAIGVSGSCGQREDIAIGQAAVAAIVASLAAVNAPQTSPAPRDNRHGRDQAGQEDPK